MLFDCNFFFHTLPQFLNAKGGYFGIPFKRMMMCYKQHLDSLLPVVDIVIGHTVKHFRKMEVEML
jgi:hypothetical protein